jgi:hypothetical protein
MTDTSWLGPPIDVRPLFAGQQAAFIALLRGLRPGQWAQPTVCPGWDVKDIAAHVLGDHVGRLSRHRDGYSPLRPRDGEPFPAFLDRINTEWVIASRRLSPRLRHATAPEDAVLQMVVTGPGGGSWTCIRAPGRWRLRREPHPRPTARVELDPDTAWRLCTRGITPGHAAGRARVDGDRQLAAAALQIVSIIWSPPDPTRSGIR